MNLYNATVTISKWMGDENSKSYSTLDTGVRAMIRPAGTDILALFPDLPIGQAFSFVIQADDLVIPPESLLTVTATDGEFIVSDQFIVRGEVMRQRLLTQYVLKGVCVKNK